MDAPLASLRRAVFRLAEQGAALSALYHRARLLGCEHLPLKGPVLLVGNHGVWGYETPAFFHLIHQGTGRYPLGLTERGFFRIPLIRTVLPWLGGVAGTRENAMTALRADSRVGRGIPMLETLSSRPGGHPHGPPLVPDADDIQQGDAHLPCERRPVRGTPVRLFTFPEGNTDESRTVVCLPGLGASGRSFAPMEPLTDALTLSTLVRAPRPLAYLLAPTVARVLGGQRLPPEGRAEIVREARRLSPVELLRRLRDILATDLMPRLHELQVPTLVIQGGRDLLVPPRAARDVARHIPGARLALIRGASHLPYMSHPDAFNTLAGDFLRQHLD